MNAHIHVLWFNPAAAKHHRDFHSPPPSPPHCNRWKRIRRKKKLELVDWGKNYLLRQKRKIKIIVIIIIYTHTYTKEVTDKQLLTTLWPMLIQSPSSSSSPSQFPTIFYGFFFFIIYFGMMSYGTELPLNSLGQLSWFCTLSAPCAPQTPLLAGQ